MKGKIISLIFLMLLLGLIIAYAEESSQATTIKEQVKCIFLNSGSEQKCYTGDGTFSCSGTESCTAQVEGENGKTLDWKSSCGGYASTVIDGVDDSAEFKCEIPVTTPTPVPECSENKQCWDNYKSCYYSCSDGKCVPFQTILPLLDYPDCESTIVKEQVKCIFANSAYAQKCYTDDGRFGCSGEGSCTADVSDNSGTKLAWKSTCGGYAYTVVDGNSEYAEFKCEVPTSTPAEIVKEQVKCIFANSNSEQTCYPGNGQVGCSGTGTCVTDISGEKGKTFTWKSTCGGYAYTVIDGSNEYAEFNCQQTTTQTPTATPVPTTTTTPTQPTTQECKDSDGLNYFLKGYVESMGMKNFDTCRVINSNTDYYDTSECAGSNCYVLESSCSEEKTARAAVWKCHDSCKDGACIGTAKEQVRCIFVDPEIIQRCYADMGRLGCQDIKRECYTDDGKFGCLWEGGVTSGPIEGGGFKYTPDCIAEISSEDFGKKLTWKSSCGGYGYTVIDGNHEEVEFTCVPSSNVTAEQISGKGFLHAYWQCYDGAEEKSVEGVDMTACKSSEIWQEYAGESCKNHCYPDGSKCGVNSFSISGECYIDVEKGGVFISPGEADKKIEGIPVLVGESGKTEETKKAEEILICKDSCPLDGKCYPFGYRKEGKYCSDEGAFKEQLKSEETCENNFECSTNVCVDGKCISSGLIKKIMSWFMKLFGGGEAKKEDIEIIDCGASNECMENAFKACKPAKINQGGSVSEIVGIESEKCVLKMTADDKSMTCKFENYKLGTKNLGNMEQYCEGELVKYLGSFTTASGIQSTSVPATEPSKETQSQQPEKTKRKSII